MRGQLKLVICASSNKLTVTVLEICDVPTWPKTMTKTYVKLSLTPNDVLRQRFKTPAVDLKTGSGIYHETLTFELLPDSPCKRLLISVWSRDSDELSEFKGCMSFGLNSLHANNKIVHGWYCLLGETLGRRKHLAARGRLNSLSKEGSKEGEKLIVKTKQAKKRNEFASSTSSHNTVTQPLQEIHQNLLRSDRVTKPDVFAKKIHKENGVREDRRGYRPARLLRSDERRSAPNGRTSKGRRSTCKTVTSNNPSLVKCIDPVVVPYKAAKIVINHKHSVIQQSKARSEISTEPLAGRHMDGLKIIEKKLNIAKDAQIKNTILKESFTKMDKNNNSGCVPAKLTKRKGTIVLPKVCGFIDEDRGYFSDPDICDKITEVVDIVNLTFPEVFQFEKKTMAPFSTPPANVLHENSSEGLTLEDLKAGRRIESQHITSFHLLAVTSRKEHHIQENDEENGKIAAQGFNDVMTEARKLFGSSISLCSEKSYAQEEKMLWMRSLERIKKLKPKSDNFNLKRRKKTLRRASRNPISMKIEEDRELRECHCDDYLAGGKNVGEEQFCRTRINSEDLGHPVKPIGRVMSWWNQRKGPVDLQQSDGNVKLRRASLSTILTGSEKRMQRQCRLSEPNFPKNCEATFADILTDKVSLQAFRSFLQSEFSGENLNFWENCEEYKSLKPNKQTKAAQRIYSQFLEVLAPDEVNIDAETRAKTRERVKSPDASTFLAAQDCIYRLMNRDSFPRFLGSDFYQKLVLQKNFATNENGNSNKMLKGSLKNTLKSVGKKKKSGK